MQFPETTKKERGGFHLTGGLSGHSIQTRAVLEASVGSVHEAALEKAEQAPAVIFKASYKILHMF